VSKLKGHQQQKGTVIQVVSKIQARALRIVDYIKEKAEGKKEVAIDSKEAMTLPARLWRDRFAKGVHPGRAESREALPCSAMWPSS